MYYLCPRASLHLKIFPALPDLQEQKLQEEKKKTNQPKPN